ncbi:NADP-dependent oxidoreductase [Thermosporothrix hazakensis]|jgi:NADPH:quinone reductase-like Zn-dependent oxidoreductase|nr:NADP-dependent oxidoreductase [Thermosporothrix hazakensis]GCE50541.1 NADPH:quinone reductase [Thermosporothrix hazakensis]
MMRAIRVSQYGGPEQLKLEEVPRPEPQAGEVLIRVHAVGVLPMEWKLRRGLFQGRMPLTLPYIPGSAIAGGVEQVGPGVETFRVGQAVFGRTSKGGYAEYTTAAIENLALKPEGLSFVDAATISGGATVAFSALFENAKLQAGQRVLIHGAAGGVGLFAVQFARWKGAAEIIATASAQNEAFVRALGAQTVINYAKTRFEDVVHDIDVVLDTIGGETLTRSMQVVKPGGILVSLLEEPSQEEATRLGIRAMSNKPSFPWPSTELLQTIARLMTEEGVKTEIARTFPLHEAAQAHTLSETGHGRGRIVLLIH